MPRTAGLNCACGGPARAIDSWRVADGLAVVRRRECLSCGLRFTTREVATDCGLRFTTREAATDTPMPRAKRRTEKRAASRRWQCEDCGAYNAASAEACTSCAPVPL
jgi:transcriptional regulator NrdR family protein